MGGLRIAIRVVALASWLLACVPLFYLWKLTGRDNPWPRTFLGGAARLAGVRTSVRGRLAAEHVFLLSNHVSWIDILALAGTTGAAFVAHSGLAGHPFLRWLCEMNETVFVARHDRGSVHEQVEQVRKAIGGANALAIFPEGTTSDGLELLPFKSSLLSAFVPPPPGVAIQPVYLEYGPDVREIAWVDAEPGVTNFKRILARAEPVALTVHLLPPLKGDALANRKTIAAAAREAISATMLR